MQTVNPLNSAQELTNQTNKAIFCQEVHCC